MFDIAKLRKIQLEMLVEFLNICKKYNLKYFLINGSCLGTVKYKGFIPWDDDIDVGMFREDYDKFLEIAQNELPEHIFLQHLRSDKEYLSGYAKLRNSNTTFMESSSAKLNINHGVYLDIFPLDGYKKSLIFKLKYKFYNNFIGLCYNLEHSSLKKALCKAIYKIFKFNLKNFAFRLENNVKKYKVEYLENVQSAYGAWGKKEIHKKSVYGNGTEAEFEGIKVIIPEQYDEYLTTTYGNYINDIPDDEKISHHYCDVIDLDKSYKEYLK